jgi:hypothetical protein
VAIVDSKGRVFGRVNVIDAFVLLVLIALVPTTLAAYRAFRARPVTVISVSPKRLFIGLPVRLDVTGTEFRPYLQVFVAKAGEAFSMEEVNRSQFQGTYLLSSPSSVELRFPDLGRGTYDLFLAEHGRVIISLPAAFSVGQPDYPQGVRTLNVQFYPPPEAVPLIRVGDKDFVEPRLPTSPVSEPAVVTAVEPRHVKREVVDMRMTPKQDRWIGQPMIGELVEVTLRLPVMETTPDHWAYGEAGIRVGGLFTLTTDRYRLHGVVTFLGPVERVERPRQ